MKKLDDRDIDRLLDLIEHRPDTWRLQLLRQRITGEIAARKARPFFLNWRFEPALVAAMLLGLVLGTSIPPDRFYEEQNSTASILQLSGDDFSVGGG
jgi:hypothetical protein